MFCKHEWKLLLETTTESQMELIEGLDMKITGDAHMRLFMRKHIQVFHCKKCGKLKRFVENI
jgi:23S rRNA maturation mini-RNase III